MTPPVHGQGEAGPGARSQAGAYGALVYAKSGFVFFDGETSQVTMEALSGAD